MPFMSSPSPRRVRGRAAAAAAVLPVQLHPHTSLLAINKRVGTPNPNIGILAPPFEQGKPKPGSGKKQSHELAASRRSRTTGDLKLTEPQPSAATPLKPAGYSAFAQPLAAAAASCDRAALRAAAAIDTCSASCAAGPTQPSAAGSGSR